METWKNYVVNTRTDVAELFLSMIRPLKPLFSPGHAWLKVDNAGVCRGGEVDGMEVFARILWGLGPLWSQDNSSLSARLQEEAEEWRQWYLEGIIHGTDPDHEEYWGSITDYDQRMAEMAALATAFSLSPELLWYPLSEKQKRNLYLWITQINERKVYPNSCRFYRILVNMMFDLLELPWSEECIKDDKAIVEGCYIGDGWYYDGNLEQLDYYTPFAMHFYGLIYARLAEQADPEYSTVLKVRAGQFSKDFVYLFSDRMGDIPYERNPAYRFAHGAFFSVMSYARVQGIDYGVMKHLALKNLECRLQSIPATGIIYWGFKTFFLLAMPDEHPFWQSGEVAGQDI